MQRRYQMQKHTPLAYFKHFKDQMDILKNQVETFNTRQNILYGASNNADRYQQKADKTTEKYQQPLTVLLKNKKILLKKMTEPKYHTSVIKHLTDREKEWAQAKQKNSFALKISKSIHKSNINEWIEKIACQENKVLGEKNQENRKIGNCSYNSEILTRNGHKQNSLQRLNACCMGSTKSQSRIRINMRKMHKKLEKEWIKTQNYKANMKITEPSFQDSQVSYCNRKNGDARIRRQTEIIRKVRINRPETSLLSYYSRVQTENQSQFKDQIDFKQIR